LRASPSERFQMDARRLMGGEGCPDALARKTSSAIVATVVPRLELARDRTTMTVDLSFTNAGRAPEGLHKRHLVTTPDRARTDHLWIFDRLSGNWLEYRG